ncbi:MAG: CPBP family intramembrane metalloprotease [Planctomycetes bacterium]|nr:CPBP family intramembrane metalloprotease [Planctomycetota bacterium]
MVLFPDASPDRPVYLSCDCGGRLTLDAPPESWPLACPGCGRPLVRVDGATIGSPGAGTKLLASTGATEVPARVVPLSGAVERFRSGLPAPRETEPVMEIAGRDFRNRPVRRIVKVEPPETFGMETFALALWLAVVLGVMLGHALLTEAEFTAVSVLLSSALFAGATVVFVLLQTSTVFPTLRQPSRAGPWFTFAAAGVPVSVGVVALYFRALRGSGELPLSDPLQDLLRDPASSLPILVLAVGVMPGFFEELGFRGWMQSTWREIVSPRRAIVLTACVFTVVHFSILSIAWLLPMGLWLGWLRERSGSLWPGVLAHAGHNIGMVLLMRFTG